MKIFAYQIAPSDLMSRAWSRVHTCAAADLESARLIARRSINRHEIVTTVELASVHNMLATRPLRHRLERSLKQRAVPRSSGDQLNDDGTITLRGRVWTRTVSLEEWVETLERAAARFPRVLPDEIPGIAKGWLVNPHNRVRA